MNPQFTSGEVVTAAKMNQLPKGILGYAEKLTNQTGIGSTMTDITGLSVTVTLVAGRRIQVSGFSQLQQQTAAASATGTIREGTTELSRWVRQSLATGNVTIGYGSVILTPSAGSHTYKLSLSTSAGTIDQQAGATIPAFILVEDIGAST